MKNKNKLDAMFDVIEAGDTESLEQQNARHISQMKTLLDDHLAQQQSILTEFTKSGKANTTEMKKWKEEMTRERPDTLIDQSAPAVNGIVAVEYLFIVRIL